jgi:hypothetical protein
VVILLLNDLDPNTICKTLRLCNTVSNQSIKIKGSAIDLSKINLNTVECQICTYLISLADNLVKTNKTEQEIVNELERVCNLFSSDIKPQVKDNFLFLYY